MWRSDHIVAAMERVVLEPQFRHAAQALAATVRGHDGAEEAARVIWEYLEAGASR